MDARTILVVAAGGAAGSLARWGLAQLLSHDPDEIPVSTWLANATGALAIGILVVVAARYAHNRYLVPLVGVGFLGGYTTFSAYAVEILTLAEAGRPGLAVVYLLGTLVTGLPTAWAGLALTRAATRARTP